MSPARDDSNLAFAIRFFQSSFSRVPCSFCCDKPLVFSFSLHYVASTLPYQLGRGEVLCCGMLVRATESPSLFLSKHYRGGEYSREGGDGGPRCDEAKGLGVLGILFFFFFTLWYSPSSQSALRINRVLSLWTRSNECFTHCLSLMQ